MISQQHLSRIYPKIAVALQNELGRVPQEDENNRVFLLARVSYKAVLGVHYHRQQQKKSGQRGDVLIIIFSALKRGPSMPMQIGYARVSKTNSILIYNAML